MQDGEIMDTTTINAKVNDIDFQKQPQRKRRRGHRTRGNQNGVQTRNRYEVLSSDESEESGTDTENAKKSRPKLNPKKNENHQNTREKISPIVITSEIQDHAVFIQTIRSLAQDSKITTQLTRNGFKIFLNSKHSFETVQNGLKNIPNLTYYTHLLKEDKPKHIVAKGLPPIKIEDIKTDIEEQGFKTEKIVIMRNKEKRETNPPFYLITFAQSESLQEVRAKLQYIYRVKVKWEKYKNSRKVTQCHRCQDFGHGSSSCHNVLKCLHCDEQHLTKDCSKDRNDKPKCANCKGNHRANSTECPSYTQRLELIQKLREKRGHENSKYATKPAPEPRLFPTPKWSKPHIPNTPTWPVDQQTLSDTMPKKIRELQEIKMLIKEINDLCNVKELIKNLKNLKSNLEKCGNQQERNIIFMSSFYHE